MDRWETEFPAMSLARAPGVRRPHYVAAPAINTEWSLALTEGAWYRLVAAHTTIAVTVASPNVVPGVVITDGNSTIYKGQGSADYTADATLDVNYLLGTETSIPSVGVGPAVVLCPPIFMEAGWTIGSYTQASAGSFQYGAVVVILEQITLGVWGDRGKQKRERPPTAIIELEV